MRILFLTQYFPPETGAPQNRIYSLALHLAGNNNEVTILTAMPNYPEMRIFKEYRHRLYVHEKDGSLLIHRSWIYIGKNKKAISRLANYFSFVFSAIIVGLLKVGRQDIIICESPPLFLGIAALILTRLKKAKLIFNVSDLWPESVEKLGIVKNKTLLKAAFKIEKRIYLRSVLVSGQTKGIIENIKTRFPGVDTYWLPNGIDFNQFDINTNGSYFRQSRNIQDDTFLVLYAGIFGYAQGLETVLYAAENLRDKQNIKFILVGDGPERHELTNIAARMNLGNLEFIPNRPRNEMPGIISACDAYIVPLKNLDLFMGAIPSKIFEPLAMGKPVILGVNGEARELFIEQGRCGLYYEPEDYSELARCVMILEQDRSLTRYLGENGRNYVMRNFDRAIIAQEFQKKLNQFNN